MFDSAKLHYDNKSKRLRITVYEGGPRYPEIIFDFSREGPPSVKAFNPLDHDPSARGLTGWSWLIPPEELSP